MYSSLNKDARKRLESAMSVLRNHSRVRDYSNAKRTALEIAREFYGESPESKREMGGVYREIGDLELIKGEPGFWQRLFNLPF